MLQAFLYLLGLPIDLQGTRVEVLSASFGF